MKRIVVALLAMLMAFPAAAQLPGGAEIVVNRTPIIGGTTGLCLYQTSAGKVGEQACSTGAVTTFSAGTTGFTPNSATAGAVTLAGVLIGANGGSGVANTGTTFTRGGNVVFSGAFGTTITVTGTTGVTLPTSGTLVNDAVTTLSSLASIGTITTGVWNAGSVTSSSSLTAAAGSFVGFVGRSRFTSAANGNMLVSNGGISDFTCFQLGGVGNTFPAICRNGTTAAHRLADNSADGPMSASTATLSAVVNAATTSALCYNTGTGAITYNSTIGTCTVSTITAKDLDEPLEPRQGLDVVMAMRPWIYHLKPGRSTYTPGAQMGMIAEYARAVDPRLVAVNDDGSVAGFRYEQYTAALTAAIQELKREINELRESR